MGEVKKKRKRPPAKTPEEAENRCISLAYETAEQQLEAGTASSQIINHFLKLGSERETLERERLKHQVELDKAKTEALKSNEKIEELYKEAISAMKQYSGQEMINDD